MKLVLSIFLIITSSALHGQNLISNGGFEDYTDCPTGQSELNKCVDWFDVVSTTDYLVCDAETATLNIFPSASGAHTGEAYIGIASTAMPNTVETIGQELSTPLVPSDTYVLSFYSKVTTWENFDDNCQGICLYGFTMLPNGLPVTLTCPTSLPGYELLGCSANIVGENWTYYEIEFTPTTTVNYIALGQECQGCYKFAFVDDVELINTTPPVEPVEPVESEEPQASDSSCLKIPNVITPNNDGVNDHLTLSLGCGIEGTIRILDRWGNTVFFSDDLSFSWDGKCNGETVSNGTYFYIVETSSIDVFRKHGFLMVLE